MSKKTVQLIVEGENDYLITLKANQPTLYNSAQQLAAQETPLSQAESFDNSHGRQVYRQAHVYPAPPILQLQWSGLSCFIWVERSGWREGKPFTERHCYICSLLLTAKLALEHIQQHWQIENRLHWVKDVTFHEDLSPQRGGNAPANWAILRSWFITIARHFGYRTIPQAQRALANQLPKIFSFFV